MCAAISGLENIFLEENSVILELSAMSDLFVLMCSLGSAGFACTGSVDGFCHLAQSTNYNLFI